MYRLLHGLRVLYQSLNIPYDHGHCYIWRHIEINTIRRRLRENG